MPLIVREMAAASTDVLILGAGHNGLIAASYLAKAGLKVRVVERRGIVGGVCVTEEIAPGFHLSTTSYSCGLLRPQIKEDLELSRFGLVETHLDPEKFVPFPDGRHAFVYDDREKTAKEFAKFSKKDAQAYPAWCQFWDQFSEIVDPTLLAPPPPIADLAGMFRGAEAEEVLRRMLLMSAAELLDETFESEEVKAILVTSSTIGTMSGPRTPGSAYILGHHLIGDIGGVRGRWGIARGGMGAVTQALAGAALHWGAKIETGAEVRRLIVKDGAVRGAELSSGERIEAKAVISNIDPKQTFLKLAGPDHLPAEFVRGIERLKTEGSVLKVNCAISELPDWKALPGTRLGPQHIGFQDICPSIDYLERAYDAAKYGRMSEKPFLDCLIQSASDPTVAPPGKHTLSIFTQYFPYHLRKGSWDDHREEAGDLVIDTLCEYAPNMRKAILHRQVITPLDLERTYGLTEGNIFHAEITPDQMFSFRPVPGWSEYRTPIDRLYLCGSGAHPGGGVMGGPGHNGAQAVLEDWRAGRLI